MSYQNRSLVLVFLIISCLTRTDKLLAHNDSAIKQKIQDIAAYALTKGECYNDLRYLCKSIGHRISGSVAAEHALDWYVLTMKEIGIDQVWHQPVKVPYWNRGHAELIITSEHNKPLMNPPVLALGNAIGTPNAQWLEADLVMVEDKEALEAIPNEAVKGKIVYMNHPFPHEHVNTFHAYGKCGSIRFFGPQWAAQKGAIAFIMRSISTGIDDVPHTGVTSQDTTGSAIPSFSIGNISADKLATYLQEGHRLKAKVKSSALLPIEKLSSNAIGEIKGSKFPEKIIVIGAHIDSWDVGEGAHDDGAGLVQCLDAIRILKALNVDLKYTIRVVGFINEENGNQGGTTYADSAQQQGLTHVLAIESDAGGFSPRGFGIKTNNSALKTKIKQQLQYLKPLGLYDFEGSEGGVDIGPLAKQGVTLSGLIPDSQRYFDFHHTALDVFEAVNQRELKLGAAAIAGYLYLVNELETF